MRRSNPASKPIYSFPSGDQSENSTSSSSSSTVEVRIGADFFLSDFDDSGADVGRFVAVAKGSSPSLNWNPACKTVDCFLDAVVFTDSLLAVASSLQSSNI